MNQKHIYFNAPYISDETIASVSDTLKNGWIAPVGPELDAFEEQLCELFRYDHALALNSGTAALHLAVKLTGVGRGDHVVVGSFTFVAVANVVKYEGAIPVFMDSEAATWCLDPDLLETYLKEQLGQDTFPKAVIVTHIFGRTARMKRLKDICDKYGVALIEDAAEALGTKCGDQPAGATGTYGVLSFNGNKLLTTGGGGALITRSREDYQRALHWATQSKEAANHYLHAELGYNYRLSNILAGLGLGQLRQYEDIKNRKNANASFYADVLKGLDWLEPCDIPNGSSQWVNTCLIKPEALADINPDRVVQAFQEQNIEVRRFWRPLHLQPLYRESTFIGEGYCEDLFLRGFCLPSGAGLSHAELDRIVHVLVNL